MRKVGRNDPCPCGSGKKYKKCCMLKDMERKISDDLQVEGEISPEPDDRSPGKHLSGKRAAEVENIFRRASNYLDRNEYGRAAKAFRSVLLMDPEHYQALAGLGWCLAETGMQEDARKCFEKALEINPNYTQAKIYLQFHG